MSASSSVRVSVLIPTFNYGRFLRESLASVFAQTETNYEVIIVDDGSTDETADVLRSVSDPRVKVFRTSHGGIPNARNRALREASGEFIAFLDADDRWRPEKLEKQLAVLLSEPSVGVVFNDLIRFTESKLLPNEFSFCKGLFSIKTRPSSGGLGRVILGDALSEIITLEQLPTFLQATLFRRSVLSGLEFPQDLRICEDSYFAMRVYGRTQVAYIPEILTEVRRHGNNSYRVDLDLLKSHLKALLILERDVEAAQHKKAVQELIGQQYARIGHDYFWNGQPFLSGQSYIQSLRYPRPRLSALLHLVALPCSPVVKLFPARAKGIFQRSPTT